MFSVKSLIFLNYSQRNSLWAIGVKAKVRRLSNYLVSIFCLNLKGFVLEVTFLSWEIRQFPWRRERGYSSYCFGGLVLFVVSRSFSEYKTHFFFKNNLKLGKKVWIAIWKLLEYFLSWFWNMQIINFSAFYGTFRLKNMYCHTLVWIGLKWFFWHLKPFCKLTKIFWSINLKFYFRTAWHFSLTFERLPEHLIDFLNIWKAFLTFERFR